MELLSVIARKDCEIANLIKKIEALEDKNKENASNLADLECLVVRKDCEITRLVDKIEDLEIEDDQFDHIDEINGYSKSDDNLFSDESDIEPDEITPQNKEFQCDTCDFQTESSVGLKIHKTKVHKLKCEVCDKEWDCREKLKRHEGAEDILQNISDKEHKDGFKLKQHLVDETCLGVFTNASGARELPLLFLHIQECWDRQSHTCSDLPVASQPGVLNEDEDVVFDFDFYDPTKHACLEGVVWGDITSPGCTMDWQKIFEMMKT